MKRIRHVFTLRGDALPYTRRGLGRLPGRYTGLRESGPSGALDTVRFIRRNMTANHLARWLLQSRAWGYRTTIWRSA